MDLIRQLACYWDFENLDYEKFTGCSLIDLRVGDLVRVSQYTFSQKYTIQEGYEDYNCVRIGIFIGDNKLYCPIEGDQFEETLLYVDPGTSGWVNFEKYVE